MFIMGEEMKLAIVGSRKLTNIDLAKYVSGEISEIVSGGAVGVDFCASEYANNNGLKLTEFLPQYERYGRAAPIIRNKQIADYADKIIVFWDGKSKGALSVIKYSQKIGKPLEVILCK